MQALRPLYMTSGQSPPHSDLPIPRVILETLVLKAAALPIPRNRVDGSEYSMTAPRAYGGSSLPRAPTFLKAVTVKSYLASDEMRSGHFSSALSSHLSPTHPSGHSSTQDGMAPGGPLNQMQPFGKHSGSV